MKIYAFSRFSEDGKIYAYFTVDGKRDSGPVWQQGDQFHVCTGTMFGRDHARHDFSEAQTAAYLAFRSSSAYSVDYEGIA